MSPELRLPAGTSIGTIDAADGLRCVGDVLDRTGIALFEGVTSRHQLRDWTETFMTVLPHPDSDDDGITVITDRGEIGRPNGLGFTSAEMRLHTDRSALPEPPALQVIACRHPADIGGDCLVADGRAVYAELAAHHREALHVLSTPGSATFGAPTDTYIGSVFERLETPDGEVARYGIRLRLDELFSGTDAVQRRLPLLREIIDRHTIRFSVAAGQGYLIDNRRWLHARTAFRGTRIMWRMHGTPRPAAGIRIGFPEQPSTTDH